MERDQDKGLGQSPHSTVLQASRYGIGTVCVISLALIWVALAEILVLVQDAQVDLLFLTLSTRSVFLLWLPVAYVLGRRWGGASLRTVFFPSGLALTALFTVVFIAWAVSLTRTDLAANGAIYMSASVFVYAAEVVLFSAAVRARKVAAVAVTVLGVTLVALGSSHASARALPAAQIALGYGCLFVTTIAYALYEVLCGALLPDARDAWASVSDALTLVSILGAWTVIGIAPCLLLAHWTGLTAWSVPPPRVLALLALEGALDSAFNILLVLGILATGPLFVSIGTTLVIPVSMLTDAALHGKHPSPLGVIGSLLIVSGLFVMEYRAIATSSRQCCHPTLATTDPPLLSDAEARDYATQHPQAPTREQ